MLDQTWEILRLLGPGLRVTVQLTLIAGALSIAVSLLVGTARQSRLRLLRFSAGVFVEFFRGTSAIVQLFWVFFALPLLGISLSPMTAAVMVLALGTGAYGAEIVRGAIQAVPAGQREAAIALSIGPVAAMRQIIVPQAIPAMIPPLTNRLIELLKSTSLVSLITISDMTFIGDTIRGRTGDTGLVFLILFVLYYLLAACIALIGRYLERVLKARAGHRRPAGTSRRGATNKLGVPA